jgi:four helix bundle protein
MTISDLHSKQHPRGCGRDTPGDFARFLPMAYGSGCELGTQATIAGRLGFGDAGQLTEIGSRTDEIRRMIYAFISQLSDK